MDQFKKRLKSFGWRLAAYLAVSALAWVADNLGMLELPVYVTTILALVIGEITKYINNILGSKT